jgi:hypothetical protein
MQINGSDDSAARAEDVIGAEPIFSADRLRCSCFGMKLWHEAADLQG